jgi:hypothetical protein
MFDSTGDVPYAYRERQVSATVLLALADFADAVFAEAPVRRGPLRRNTPGWADYWVAFRQSTFIMEVKRDYSAIRRRTGVSKSVISRWSDAENQLKSIHNLRCEDLRYSTGHIIKSPLFLVSHWASSKQTGKLSMPPAQSLVNRHEEVVKGVTPEPRGRGPTNPHCRSQSVVRVRRLNLDHMCSVSLPRIGLNRRLKSPAPRCRINPAYPYGLHEASKGQPRRGGTPGLRFDRQAADGPRGGVQPLRRSLATSLSGSPV